MMQRGYQVARVLLGIWMAGVVVGLFLVVPRYEGLGNVGRIMILHVPTAWVSVLAFAVSAFFSGRYLWRGRPTDDDRALAAAECGFLFTILATVTGMIFSQAVWGIYWNWDPRQTSIFVLLLIYAAMFALRASLENVAQRRQLSAVYSIFAFVTVPFLVFIAPRMSESTLHPNCVFLPGSKCEGVELAVGNVGLLGDRKVSLLGLEERGTTLTAQVKMSEPGLASETMLFPTFDLATGKSGEAADIPGVRHRLVVQRVDRTSGRVLLNLQAPGTGILGNQRTLLMFLASMAGFTALFVWLLQIRATLLEVQWLLTRREEQIHV
ncbi:MAG: cytochrome c biogenesis protein CcsA [Chloroflexaceae bacterium]|nr:cytochrome c biogenesis protein CcsA [Chloroflexaceae bacterium]